MEKTVLLIEDDQVLSENTKELLELSGYRVISSQDGKCGLKKAFQELPDLIISDIMMPELDGYEVYKALQQNRKTCNIPFIFISAKSNPSDVRLGMNLGADDYITKPFGEEDLILAVEKRLEKREQILQTKKEPKNPNSEYQLEKLKEYFRTYGEQLEAEKHEEIFLESRNASNIYLVEYGLIKTFRFDEFGKELITGISQKNDFVGFYSFKLPSSYPENATALERSILFRVSHEEFVQLLEENQDLTLEFAELLSIHLDDLKSHLLEMAYGSVLKKTASTLLEFTKKLNTGSHQVLTVSRSDMASVAGISTESFIRSLSFLKNEGVIDIVGRNIKIVNLQKLKSIY